MIDWANQLVLVVRTATWQQSQKNSLKKSKVFEDFLKWSYPGIIHFRRIFPHEPSHFWVPPLMGTPHFENHGAATVFACLFRPGVLAPGVTPRRQQRWAEKFDIWGCPEMGVPPHGWFIRENPNLKWMIARGTPILGNLHVELLCDFQKEVIPFPSRQIFWS